MRFVRGVDVQSPEAETQMYLNYVGRGMKSFTLEGETADYQFKWYVGLSDLWMFRLLQTVRVEFVPRLELIPQKVAPHSLCG